MASPIITCGDSKLDATGVHGGMKPEYDVIYAAFTLKGALEELPKILAGHPPAAETLHTQIASNSFERRPKAVVIGGGYNDEAFKTLRDACIEACGSKEALGLAFFRASGEITDKLHAEGKGPVKKGEGYAQAITQRLKAKLAEVGVEKGVAEEGVGELFWF